MANGGAAGGSKGSGGAGSGGAGGAGTATSWVHGTDPFPGVTTGDLTAIAVTANGDIYAGRQAGLAKSSDRGASWTTVSGSLPSPVVPSLGVNALGEVVAAVGADGSAMGKNSGAYRFTAGAWKKSTGITATGAITGFALDKTGAVIAVTAYDGDVWRSTDNGDTYVKVGSHIGSSTTFSAGALWAVTALPNGELYTGGEEPAGLYRSTDNGTTWTQFGLAAPPFTGNLNGIGYNHLGELLVSRLDSSGNPLQRYSGGAWTAPTGVTQYSVVKDIILNPRSNTIYLSETDKQGSKPGGVFTSSDDGKTWRAFSSGLPAKMRHKYFVNRMKPKKALNE
jgi:hypothetical protein